MEYADANIKTFETDAQLNRLDALLTTVKKARRTPAYLVKIRQRFETIVNTIVAESNASLMHIVERDIALRFVEALGRIISANPMNYLEIISWNKSLMHTIIAKRGNALPHLAVFDCLIGTIVAHGIRGTSPENYLVESI